MEFLDTMAFMLDQIYQISYYAKPFTIAFAILLLLILFSVVGIKSRLNRMETKIEALHEAIEEITEWINGAAEEGERKNE